jgi:hypothetical protein
VLLAEVEPSLERDTRRGDAETERAPSVGLGHQLRHVPVGDDHAIVDEPAGAAPRHGVVDELHSPDARDPRLDPRAMGAS